MANVIKKTHSSIVNFSKLIKEDTEDLYVMNNTGRSKTIQPGSLTCTVNTDTGLKAIQIPWTWVPLNIAQQAERKAILKSPDFRLMITRGWVKIMDEDKASEILARPDAQREWDHVQLILSGATRDDIREVVETGEADYDPILETINAKIVEAIRREDIKESEQLSIIMQHANLGVLTEEEEQYIMDNTQFDRVKAFIASNT